MKPIYEPRGKAKEYGDLALNIYTGCPHRCFYCFAPNVLRRDREEFHSHIEPRKDIVQQVGNQLSREHITGKLIHLCFTCDPYPTGYDTTTTRDIIRLLKQFGNHVQILTKGDGRRDFDLLDENDWYGITMDCGNDYTSPVAKYGCLQLAEAKARGIHTWVSFEPVLSESGFEFLISECQGLADKVKIGKLNYWPSEINWHDFGHKAENLCKSLGFDYYIKDSLRAEMDKP